MAPVGLGGVETAPSQLTACPIPLAVLQVVEELLERHRGANWRALATVVGNTGVGADSRPRQHGETLATKEVQRRFHARADLVGNDRVRHAHLLPWDSRARPLLFPSD